MLTLEEIKALEYCVGNVTPIGVPQARMLVLAADALKRERTIAEILEKYRREQEKEKEVAPYKQPWAPAPMPTWPAYPLPGYGPAYVGDFPPGCGRPITTCGGPTTTDFPRTG